MNNKILYAVGDIHGRFDLLIQLQKKIERDATQYKNENKILIYLGDYIDRGKMSKAVIENFVSHPLNDFKTYYLKGNHEDMMLNFLTHPKLAESWFINGGLETLASYGISLNYYNYDLNNFSALRDKFLEVMPSSHLQFFKKLITHHVEDNFLFCHAGIRPGVPLNQQSERDLLWIRDEFLYSSEDHGFTVVHGHSISTDPVFQRHRIGIDTGAFYTDKLTAVVIHGQDVYFIQT